MAITPCMQVYDCDAKKNFKDLDERVTALEEGGSGENWKYRTASVDLNVTNFGSLTTDANGCIDVSDLPDSLFPSTSGKIIYMLDFKVWSSMQIDYKIDIKSVLPKYFVKANASDLNPTEKIQFVRSDGTVCANMKLIEDQNSDLSEVVFDYRGGMVTHLMSTWVERDIPE